MTASMAYELGDFMRRYGVDETAIGIVEEHYEIVKAFIREYDEEEEENVVEEDDD